MEEPCSNAGLLNMAQKSLGLNLAPDMYAYMHPCLSTACLCQWERLALKYPDRSSRIAFLVMTLVPFQLSVQGEAHVCIEFVLLPEQVH
mmetsp:Transcript_64318/g.94185  ORF Transcript_64318/g.94185 Transcript_64318/m.94185 type:complete len:89 (+) Transcript_64318:692-958(+)